MINVFTITYPIQFLTCLFKPIFSVGCNISKEKDNDKYAVGNGIFLTIVLGFILYGFILLNIDKYITFMNMDVKVYKIFTIYSIIQLQISFQILYLLI